MPRESAPPALRRYVLAWAGAGTAVGVAVLVVFPPRLPPAMDGTLWPLVLLLAVGVLLHLGAIRFQDTQGDGEAHTLDDLVFVAALLLLVPPWPWVVVVGAAAFNELRQRRPRLRSAFNVGWYAVAAGLAQGLHAALPWRDPFGPDGLLALAVALAAYVAVNWVAIAGVRHQVGMFADLRSALLDRKIRVVATAAGALAALGIVGAFLLREAPWLAALLAVPLALIRQRSAAVSEEEAERRADHRRLERTIAAASDGIALLDGVGRVEVWNTAMARLTGLAADDVLGRVVEPLEVLTPLAEPLVGSEATHRLSVRDGDERLVAVDRAPVDLGGAARGTVLLVRDVTAEAEVVMLREDLISRVSHELRTPLTAVDGLLQTVTGRWDQLDEEARLALLTRAHGAATRLGRLVEGLLARGRLDREGGRPRPVPTRLDDVVDEVAAEVEVSLGMHVRRRRAPVVASVDPDHLAQVLTVLLENAERYGRAPVEVMVAREADEAVLRVRDHGDGVPRAFVPHLFDPFAQASTGLRRTARGLGLGLSIARELAEMNAGRLRYVPPVPPGAAGATFELRLPLASASQPDGVAGQG